MEEEISHIDIQHKPLSLLDITIARSKEKDVTSTGDTQTPSISGIEVMPDGCVVLCDWNNRTVKKLSNMFQLEDTMAVQNAPYDISTIGNNNAIITLPWLKQLQHIIVQPKLKGGDIIEIDKPCWGVEVVGDEIYITCHNYILGGHSSEGEVRILDMRGTIKRTLGISTDGYFLFDRPYYLAVSPITKKIYVTDEAADRVTCLSPEGCVVYQHNYKGRCFTVGIIINSEENALVCGNESDTKAIVILNGNGMEHKVLVTSSIGSPLSVAYRHNDASLIIGFRHGSAIRVYNI